MAQLPPKIPNVTPSWPDFSHKKLPIIGIMETSPPRDANIITAIVTNPSWVDEFLDFSSTRRGTHRRSVSDSIAFREEAPMMLEKCRPTGAPGLGSGHNSSSDFDKFDYEQLMSMFNDDISNAVAAPNSSSTPSSPSDHNSINDEKEAIGVASKHKQQQKVRNENDEGQSPSEWETPATVSTATDPAATSNERKIDPKRVKRILANRQSAQRSRVRKLQYISELERCVTSLQGEVSGLSPRVAYLDHRRLLLNVDNSALKQRIAALAQDKIFKDAHQEALKREIERLRQVYHQQNLKMENTSPPSPSSTPSNGPTTPSTDKEQQLFQV
ncbi:basic leucine zipper 34 [Populus alba]|uniref:BZIP transcription factor family protein n=1 Tax=Populus alba TaxID=43335 RepID=A0A4U5QF32_POPAL|nr:basic leucine zipper 61-like [Populus alba]TKS07075.1 bZIP transcription factor family protein [Populus alba]